MRNDGMSAGSPCLHACGEPPPLADTDVHIWLAELDQPPHILDRLQSSLDPAELERQARFVFLADRRNFGAARGLLRGILARYLGTDPSDLEFEYNAYGKPRLAGGHGLRLRFNLAHSKNLMLIAAARDREIGADIECVHHGIDVPEFAGRVFSTPEAAALNTLPAELRHEAFFACWTRKEAYLKALGEGLSIPLNSFEMAFAPGDPPRILRRADRDHRRWIVLAPRIDSETMAAVVAEWPVGAAHFYRWSTACAPAGGMK